MDSSLSPITFTKTPGCRQSAKNLSATKTGCVWRQDLGVILGST